jgi:hypothetical protein
MRVLFAVLLCLAGLASFALGFVMALEGFAEHRVVSNTYTVNFARAGDDCGVGRLELDIDDGSKLECMPSGVVPMESTWEGLPGFTDVQNDEVLELAAVDEQELVQARVDDFASHVPAEQRPKSETIITGLPAITQACLGVAMVAIPVLGYAYLSWRYR